MQRSDYYIFGLALVNIFFFTKFASMIIVSTVSSVLERGDLMGYAVFGAFLVGVVLIFNNLSRLLSLVSETETEATHQVIVQVGKLTVGVMAVFAILTLLDAYLMYNLFGGLV